MRASLLWQIVTAVCVVFSPMTAKGDPQKALLVGDSHAGGFAPTFTAYARAAGLEPVVSFQNGSRTDQWVGKIDALVARHHPAVIFVSLGSNDAARRNLDPHRFAARVTYIRNAAVANGARIVWIAPPTMPDRFVAWTDVVYWLWWELDKAQVFNTAAVDLPRQPDGVHMTPDGYEEWFDLVWTFAGID